MADRNPNIPAERRMDMENRETDNERVSKERYAQKQAELDRYADAPQPKKRAEASEKPADSEETGGDTPQETGKSTR